MERYVWLDGSPTEENIASYNIVQRSGWTWYKLLLHRRVENMKPLADCGLALGRLARLVDSGGNAAVRKYEEVMSPPFRHCERYCDAESCKIPRSPKRSEDLIR